MPPKTRPKSKAHKAQRPGVGHHKATGQAYALIAGHRHYTGPYTDPASHARALALLAEAAANGGALPSPKHAATVAEVVAAYLAHAAGYYAGSRTSLARVEAALRPLAGLYGHLPAAEFGPVRLEVVRRVWIEGGTAGGVQYRALRRSTINDYTRAIVAAFRWAAAREMIPAEVPTALGMLQSLRARRSAAKEPAKRHPVPDAVIEATLPHLPRPIAGLVRLQRACGARSSEILGLRPRDIDTTGPIWICKIEAHKTAHLGKARTLTFGPKAQAVLREHMAGKTPWAVIFSPWDSVQERAEAAETHRRPDQKPNERKTDRTVGEAYCSRSYAVAILRGIAKANAARAAEGLPPLPHWTPHMLRHSFASEARKHCSMDAVQAALGHASADVTQIYAALDIGKAAEVAAAIG
jgi:integrase